MQVCIVCVCVYKNANVRKCIYIYMYVYMYAGMYMRTYVYACIHVYIYIYIYACGRTIFGFLCFPRGAACMCVCVCVFVRVCMRVFLNPKLYIVCIHKYICVYTYTYIGAVNESCTGMLSTITITLVPACYQL